MAFNSHIISYKFEDTLYLRLIGDFDEESAQELINSLTKHGNCSGDIFIDTNNLETIFPFGRDVFQNKFSSIKKTLKNLIIIGVKKYQFENNFE